ncbi:hypothetical protein JCM10212_006478 [Sporobolomyces blumeae]
MQLPTGTQSAASLLQTLTSLASRRFSCNCQALDDLLTPRKPRQNGQIESEEEEQGLPRGGLLELVGPAGIGKSRAALGFVVAEAFASLDRQDADIGGQVLVIDAEGSLGPAMLEDTMRAYAGHNGYDNTALAQVLDRVHYRRIDSIWTLVAWLHTVEVWLAEHPAVSLVVVDSLTSHFRPILAFSTRKLVANLIRTVLASIMASRRVSVILTAHMSNKLFGLDNRPTSWTYDAEAMLVPTIPPEAYLPGYTAARSRVENGSTQDPRLSQARNGNGDNMRSGIGGEGIWRILMYFDRDGERMARLLDSPVETKKVEAAFTMDLLGPCDHQHPATPNSVSDEAMSTSHDLDLTPKS